MVEATGSFADDEPLLPDPYKLMSICSAVAPGGNTGTDWHRYEICQGHNRIVGYRAGSADTVREAVELIVVRLNMRRRMRRGRVHVMIGSKVGTGLQ